MAKVTLNSEVHLIGIGVLKILSGWEAKRLAEQRNSSRQVLLVDEHRVGVQAGKPLLLRQKLNPCRNGWRQAIARRLDTLETVRSVQIQCGCRRQRCRRVARRTSKQDDLRRLRAISNVGIEAESQQRMIVKHSVRGADHRLTIIVRIPCETYARRNVVIVTGNALSN